MRLIFLNSYPTASGLCLFFNIFFCGNILASDISKVKSGAELMQIRNQEVLECGVKTWKSKQHPLCGEVYKAKAKPPCNPIYKKGKSKKHCGFTVEEIYIPASASCSLAGATGSGKSGAGTGFQPGMLNAPPLSPEELQISGCEAEVTTVEKPKTCRHQSFGTEGYETCRHVSFGVELVKTCAHESFGPKTFYRCSLAMTREELNEYLDFVTESKLDKSIDAYINQENYYFRLRQRSQYYCMIERFQSVSLFSAESDLLMDNFEVLFNQSYSSVNDINCKDVSPSIIADSNGKSCDEYSLGDIEIFAVNNSNDGFFKTTCLTWLKSKQALEWFYFHDAQLNILLNDLIPSQDKVYKDTISNLIYEFDAIRQAF